MDYLAYVLLMVILFVVAGIVATTVFCITTYTPPRYMNVAVIGMVLAFIFGFAYLLKLGDDYDAAHPRTTITSHEAAGR